MPGKAKPIIGETYSQSAATTQRASRNSPSAKAPPIQKQHSPVIGSQRVITSQLPDNEACSPKLHCNIATSKNKTTFAKCVRYRGRHNQRQRHTEEQNKSQFWLLGVKPVCDPARILPAEPDREPENECF
jgi:hypothetical protein